MVLNAHSTAVMAKLGKVVGNTMTNVSPSNLKLVGRATYLIQLHVNDVLGRPDWVRAFGAAAAVSYEEANAVLFDSIAFMKDRPQGAAQVGRSRPVHRPHPGIPPAESGSPAGGSPGDCQKNRVARLSERSDPAARHGMTGLSAAAYPIGGRPVRP